MVISDFARYVSRLWTGWHNFASPYKSFNWATNLLLNQSPESRPRIKKLCSKRWFARMQVFFRSNDYAIFSICTELNPWNWLNYQVMFIFTIEIPVPIAIMIELFLIHTSGITHKKAWSIGPRSVICFLLHAWSNQSHVQFCKYLYFNICSFVTNTNPIPLESNGPHKGMVLNTAHLFLPLTQSSAGDEFQPFAALDSTRAEYHWE